MANICASITATMISSEAECMSNGIEGFWGYAKTGSSGFEASTNAPFTCT
jgi:hypothetical protein